MPDYKREQIPDWLFLKSGARGNYTYVRESGLGALAGNGDGLAGSKGHHTSFMRRSGLKDADFESFLPAQVFSKPITREPQTPDERLAWRKLMRDALDCLYGSAKSRIKSINEMLVWIEAGDSAIYPFSLWCQHLGVEEGYMKRVWRKFLFQQRQDVIKGKASRHRFEETKSKVRRHQLATIEPSLYRCLRCKAKGDLKTFSQPCALRAKL